MSTHTMYTGTLISDSIEKVDKYLLAERILREFTCESEPENGETCGQPATIFDLHDERAKCNRCFEREAFLMTDFVTVDECEAEALKQMEERYPEGGTLQPPWREFVINFAANVAHKCAAEATRRAK